MTFLKPTWTANYTLLLVRLGVLMEIIRTVMGVSSVFGGCGGWLVLLSTVLSFLFVFDIQLIIPGWKQIMTLYGDSVNRVSVSAHFLCNLTLFNYLWNLKMFNKVWILFSRPQTQWNVCQCQHLQYSTTCRDGRIMQTQHELIFYSGRGTVKDPKAGESHELKEKMFIACGYTWSLEGGCISEWCQCKPVDRSSRPCLLSDTFVPSTIKQSGWVQTLQNVFASSHHQSHVSNILW